MTAISRRSSLGGMSNKSLETFALTVVVLAVVFGVAALGAALIWLMEQI